MTEITDEMVERACRVGMRAALEAIADELVEQLPAQLRRVLAEPVDLDEWVARAVVEPPTLDDYFVSAHLLATRVRKGLTVVGSVKRAELMAILERFERVEREALAISKQGDHDDAA
jgi:hypothetical protein